MVASPCRSAKLPGEPGEQIPQSICALLSMVKVHDLMFLVKVHVVVVVVKRFGNSLHRK